MNEMTWLLRDNASMAPNEEKILLDSTARKFETSVTCGRGDILSGRSVWGADLHWSDRPLYYCDRGTLDA
jgi:hypothetical protein